MNKKTIVFVWAEDVGNFAKELQTKTLSKDTESIVVLGSELKISDWKSLQETNNGDIILEVDNEYSVYKKDTEIAMLGRCYEKSKLENCEICIAPFATFDKDTQEMAKRMGIATAPCFETKTKSSITKKRQPKKSVTKEPNLETYEDVSPTKGNSKKKKPDNKTKTLDLKAEPAHELIGEILQESGLSKKDKEFFLAPNHIEMIASAAIQASDEKIGFPFQLQMRFGAENAKKLESVAGKLYKALRKEG